MNQKKKVVVNFNNKIELLKMIKNKTLKLKLNEWVHQQLI